MSNNKYAAFFAAYNTSVKRGNDMTREEVIQQFTEGRTPSLKDLSDIELQELTRRLNMLTGTRYQPNNDKLDKMRKSIIAIFHDMNKTPATAKAWAEKQGVFGNKKRFNDYTGRELFALIRIAEKIRKEYYAAIRKAVR